MADQPRSPDTGGTPRWVKVSLIIAIVLALLVGVVLLLGGDGHRPRRHAPSDDPGGRPSPFSVTASGGGARHTPPVEGHTP